MINSIEIKFDKNGNIDEEFAGRRLAAYKKMFPNLDFLGWYSTGSDQKIDFPTDKEMQLQKVILKFCESPILLIMNVTSEAAANKKKVPIFLYETNQNAGRFE